MQQSFLEELERTVSLLAFEDVNNCPVAELLDISQRLKTASEVNAAILTSQSHEKGYSLFSKSASVKLDMICGKHRKNAYQSFTNVFDYCLL